MRTGRGGSELPDLVLSPKSILPVAPGPSPLHTAPWVPEPQQPHLGEAQGHLRAAWSVGVVLGPPCSPLVGDTHLVRARDGVRVSLHQPIFCAVLTPIALSRGQGTVRSWWGTQAWLLFSAPTSPHPSLLPPKLPTERHGAPKGQRIGE